MSKPRGASNSIPPNLRHYQVPPFASRLTRQHRINAQMDHAYAAHLRKQTDPARIDAHIAGRTWFHGKECAKCGGTRRRTYNKSCHDCTQLGRGFRTDAKGRCIALPPATLSRAGWLARNAERKREGAGERIEYRSGDWTVWQYPTGRLRVQCIPLHIDNPDFGSLPWQRVFALGSQHPDLVILLRQAGWSV